MTAASIPGSCWHGKNKPEGEPVHLRIGLVMLTFSDHSQGSSRLQRRDFLRIGGLGLGGLGLSEMMALKALGASQKRLLKDKSVIFLFMHGGPSQFETFDPKMDAPSEIRSVTGEIKTKIPGITFGSTFERLAKLADKFSIVRSFVTGDAVHDIKTIVGKDTLKANVGSLYSRIAGPLRKGSAMPTNVALFPQAISSAAGPVIKKFGDFTSSGEFGATYQPFVPGAGSGAQADMTLSLPQGRLDDRRTLLTSLDQWKRRMDASESVGGMSEFQSLAFDVLRRGVSDAFDLSKEDPRLIDRYDTSAAAEGPHQHAVEQPRALRRQRRHARQAAADGPTPVRAWLRLCHRHHQLCVGHARGQQQRPLPHWHGLCGPSVRSRRLRFDRGHRSTRG
jgi:hypothetical protein